MSRAISQQKLLELISVLPAGSYLEGAEATGNLRILDGPKGNYVGYVDFSQGGELTIFDWEK